MLPAHLIHSTTVSPIRLFRLSPEKRINPRVRISVGGRVMMEDRTEHGCTTFDASVKALSILSDANARIGERVVGYFDTIGRVEGSIERLIEGGFILEMATTIRKRDKLASQLTWLANREILNLPDDRRHDRVIPRDPRVDVRNLTDPAGVVIVGHLIDVSYSGAAVSVVGKFMRGDELMLGTTPARVVRAFDGGVAVEFRASIPDSMFSVELKL